MVNSQTRIRTLLLVLAVAAVLALMPSSAPAETGPLAGVGGAVLEREPQVTPQQLGSESLAGLQFADPLDRIDLIQPPVANNQGTAQLSYPMSVPPGRGDATVDLALQYSSASDNGWTGLGWDLSVGEVTIDTRWGVPRYLSDKESETYLLDGSVLSPTAVRSTLLDREADRYFKRRVEGDFERIQRHGDGPGNYWWEVTDKSATRRYYGARWDESVGDFVRDPASILDTNGSEEGGSEFRWALSQVVDISGNTVNYYYDLASGSGVGADDEQLGYELYLDRITYAGSIGVGNPDDPAYEVRFVRASDLGESHRKDVTVDARGGFVRVDSDLLRHVEVYHRGTLAEAYVLSYTEGAFGKTLLASVGRAGSDGAVYASHNFDYYDDVRPDGGYEGFLQSEDWDTKDDQLSEDLVLATLGPSALGGALSITADVRAYLGFNPFKAGKEGSFGGAISVQGGDSFSLLEFFDINGDNLPDKVYLQDGVVKFRLNQSGPNGTTTFGDEHTAGDLSGLSNEIQIGVGGGPEAYFGVSAQFNAAANISIGEAYFSDVNNDGLLDLVQAGRVHFNHLDANGIPTFSQDSGLTSVPIADGVFNGGDLSMLQDLEAELLESSPLMDTVRRWTAPFDGTVEISGDVSVIAGGPSSDGVRVAVQHNGDELWSATLAPGQGTTPDVGAIGVSKGDRIYFRVGSIHDGVDDVAFWNPTITYTNFGSDPINADGFHETVYQAADEFTLAGRPGAKVLIPRDGTVQVEATLIKTAPTSDDVTITVLHHGDVIFEQVVSGDTVNPTGLTVATDPFQVTGPQDSDDEGEIPDIFDDVEIRLVVDSPIDVTALSLEPRLTYLAPVPPDGDPISIDMISNIDIYPNSNLNAPRSPWIADFADVPDDQAEVAGRVSASISINPLNSTFIGTADAILTVKGEDGLIGKAVYTVTVPETLPGSGIPGIPSISGDPDPLDVTFVQGGKYWFDISVRDPNLSDVIFDSDVTVTYTVQVTDSEGNTHNETRSANVPDARNWAGRQGMFPIAFRGWAYAGYNATKGGAEDPIDESAFEFDRSNFPEEKPTGFNDPDYKDPMAEGEAWPFTPSILDGNPVWRGFRDSQFGGAAAASSSRLKRDEVTLLSANDTSVRAVRRVSMTPGLSMAVGIGPLGAGVGAGASLGLQDYLDMNGDSFPDIITPGEIQYTGPRGGYVEESNPGSMAVVRNDSTFTFSAGFNGNAVEINANSKGDANTSQDIVPASSNGSRTNKSQTSDGGDSNETQSGVNLGGSLGAQTSWSNSFTPGFFPGFEDLPDVPDELTLGDLPLETELNDVNGDGLPDRVRVDGINVYVSFNLGYGFADEIKWSAGHFENGESYAGSLGLSFGFNVSHFAFAGGLSFNEATDFMRTSWVDLNGDGILDRLRIPFDENEVKVAFGSGAGLLPETDFGSFSDFQTSDALPSFDLGEQISQGTNTGVGAGADFTISIGPLCFPTNLCYIIVNPGAHVDTTVSTQRIELSDVNGDGYPDSLSSTTDDGMSVRLNTTGRTNLLKTVHNPVGGEIRLDYKRDGNTVVQPQSRWVLASVEVDDNRPGDGPDTRLTTYDYDENPYNALERESLGYRTVTEHQRAFADDGNVFDDALIRSYQRTYRNGSVFESGLLEREALLDADGNAIKDTVNNYQLVDVDLGSVVDTAPTADDPAGLRLLGIAAFAERTSTEHHWFDGASIAQETRVSFQYDSLGNIVQIFDEGELELTDDDLTAVITYPDCTANDDSWAAIADSLTVTGPNGELLRKREGTMLCSNGAVTELRETTGHGTAQIDLAFDEWGNYNEIVYPENADGERYTVNYVYDDDHHASIARTEDSHGLVAEATYEPLTGRIASRTDANGQVTTYTYDVQGRLASITGPYEQGTGNTTVSFDYFPTDSAYAHAIAHNFDAFHPDDTIDTVRFVDGIGRETQTKQDAAVFTGENSAAADVMIVGGAVEFDALGRAIKNWYPTTEPLGTIGVYNTNTTPIPTVTEYTLTDLVKSVITPDGAHTDTNYGYGTDPGSGATVFLATRTDAEGGTQNTFSDVRQRILAIDVQPGTPDSVLTQYEYDAYGQLLRVIDSGGNITTHAYDLLGNRVSTDTPDGGLVTYSYDTASNLIGKQTPTLRAAGESIAYSFDFDWLVGIDYPGDTPDVAYSYGGPGAANNGAGRIIGIVDAARNQTLEYGRLGEVSAETTTMLVHNLNESTADKHTWTTSFDHDAFGRIKTVTYPDGEVVTYGYDSGGLLNSAVGDKLGTEYPYGNRLEYDEFQVRRYRETGTEVGTTYTYNAESRRLDNILTNTPDREVQDWNYTYDLVGNVLTANNDLPAPKPNLLGGPSTQEFQYDVYYQLTSATGRFDFAPNKHRDYTYALAYDGISNLVSKSQTDTIFNNPNNGIVQAPTTYDLALEYGGDAPHQVTRIGSLAYSHDANGNFTGWDDDNTGQNRSVTWNADGRVVSVANQGSTTRYTYDDTGRLAIERGPSGETAFVNRWYTVRNGAVEWKNIWAGDQRIATKREFDEGDLLDDVLVDPAFEHMIYYFHEDLFGSTNIVTDRDALVFQHLEYFPGGEIWVQEHSVIQRTPYLYAGGYYDEVRKLVNLGQRWYEPREQFFYSADPVLAEDPERVLADPGLLAAYTYAENNPLRLVDRDGRAPEDVQNLFRAAFGRPDGSLDPAKVARLNTLIKSQTEQLVPNKAIRTLAKAAADPSGSFRKSSAFLTDKLGSKPLVEVNFDRTADGLKLKNVKFSPFFGFKQFTKGKK